MTACIFKQVECVLTINIEKGIILHDANSQKVIWQYSFEKLVRTSDDNKRLLYLTFTGEERELVSIPYKLVIYFN